MDYSFKNDALDARGPRFAYGIVIFGQVKILRPLVLIDETLEHSKTSLFLNPCKRGSDGQPGGVGGSRLRCPKRHSYRTLIDPEYVVEW